MKTISLSVISSVMFNTITVSQAGFPDGPPTLQCFERQPYVDAMIHTGASPVAIATTDDGMKLLEIWQDESGSWVAFITLNHKNGLLCPISRGTGAVKASPQICIDPKRCPNI